MNGEWSEKKHAMEKEIGEIMFEIRYYISF